MMRVLHIITSIDKIAGGTSTYMQLLAKPLGRLCELHIATHRSEGELPMENARLHYLPAWKPWGGEWKREADRLLCGLRPDIVHINGCWSPELAQFQRMAERRGVAVVLSPHGMLEPWIIRRHYYTRKLPWLLLCQRGLVRRAAWIHSTADSEAENLRRLGYNDNIRVVPLGIDTDGIAMKSDWHVRRNIVFLSRVHVNKGIGFLIEAAAALRQELQGWTVTVAGEGEAGYVAQLQAEANAAGLGDIVRFAGGVYGEHKWRLLHEADFFVLPTHSENFGFAIAEAMACGTPVITTQGAPWQCLDNEHCGAWLPVGAAPLADALRRFMALGPGELERMGRQCQQIIDERYSATVMAKRMLDCYAQQPNTTQRQ